MKTYFLKISVLSVLFVSLVPLAYAEATNPLFLAIKEL